MAVEELKRKWKGLSRWQRWSAVPACFLLLYTVSGFWILPAIARSQLETGLTRILHRQTTVQEVKFNPYTLEAAVNLPLPLAISLLKNRRGEIDLNLPVAGQLDDSEFSVTGVVFKMLANLILKAATSPFPCWVTFLRVMESGCI